MGKFNQGGWFFEYDDEWKRLIEGLNLPKDMPSYVSVGSCCLVLIDSINPQIRNESIPIFGDDEFNGVAKQERVTRIIEGFLTGLPPVVVTVSSGKYEYELYDGCHRLHLSLLAGFKHIPVIKKDPYKEEVKNADGMLKAKLDTLLNLMGRGYKHASSIELELKSTGSTASALIDHRGDPGLHDFSILISLSLFDLVKEDAHGDAIILFNICHELGHILIAEGYSCPYQEYDCKHKDEYEADNMAVELMFLVQKVPPTYLSGIEHFFSNPILCKESELNDPHPSNPCRIKNITEYYRNCVSKGLKLSERKE
jgi:hypothetical protein